MSPSGPSSLPISPAKPCRDSCRRLSPTGSDDGRRGWSGKRRDNLPGERRRQLAYKCPRYGSVLVAVEAAGTSQTCRVCHHRDPASRSDRDTFRCTNCGHVDDADHNAAAVTLHRALRTPAGAAFAAGYRGEQHAPTGRTRPVMPGSRTGRTREPLAFPLVGSEESSQATAGRMPTNIPVSS
ncbi:transposase [Streptomyces sp. NPDC051994]|uniref:transposase n=1 Tax=unclassified Streptomyces TaxID=2593676 RepID=UPI0034333B98